MPSKAKHGCGRGSLPDYWWHGRYGFSPGSISRPDSKSQASASRAFWTACKKSGSNGWQLTILKMPLVARFVQALEALGAGFDYQCRCCQSRASGDRAVTKTLWQDSRCHPRCRSGCWHDSLKHQKLPRVFLLPKLMGTLVLNDVLRI